MCVLFWFSYFITRKCRATEENQSRSIHGVINPYRLHGKEKNENGRTIRTTVRNPYKKTNVNFKEGCPRQVIFWCDKYDGVHYDLCFNLFTHTWLYSWIKQVMGIGVVHWMELKDRYCRCVWLFCVWYHTFLSVYLYFYVHNFNAFLSVVIYIIYSTQGTTDRWQYKPQGCSDWGYGEEDDFVCVWCAYVIIWFFRLIFVWFYVHTCIALHKSHSGE